MNLLEEIAKDKKFKLSSTLTPSGLPVLTLATKIAFADELKRDVAMGKTGYEMIKPRYDQMERENKMLLIAIREMVDHFLPEYQFSAAISLTNLYLLLESQLIRDRIWEYFSRAKEEGQIPPSQNL